VHFAFNRADLDDAGMTRLHEMARSLREDQRLAAELIGYTDPHGPRDYNIHLAQRRVEAVRRYLVQQGVQVSRIAAVGLGPLGGNVADKQKRRVTVAITMAETYVMPAAAPAPSASIEKRPGSQSD
jgi:outer membrane protein OmpA-like peptidoglycan-associated protein